MAPVYIFVEFRLPNLGPVPRNVSHISHSLTTAASRPHTVPDPWQRCCTNDYESHASKSDVKTMAHTQGCGWGY